MPNIVNISTGWLDLYALSGIAPGTPVNVQNQAGPILQVRENTTDPTGRVIQSYGNQDCSGTPVLQVRGTGGISLFVQELT